MKIKGLTLIELMITLAIAGVLIASAAPSMREFIQNNRSATQTNELQTALSFTRSEAIKQGMSISICKSDDGAGCGGNWQDGWVVFVDDDSDGDLDGDEEILRVHGALVAGNSLKYWGGDITYASTGLSSSASSGFFVHCDSRGASNARGIIIRPTGHTRIFSEDNFRDILDGNEWLDRFICS